MNVLPRRSSLHDLNSTNHDLPDLDRRGQRGGGCVQTAETRTVHTEGNRSVGADICLDHERSTV